MKKRFKWDSKYLYWGITAFLTLAGAIICYLLLSRLSGGLSYLRAFFSVLSPIIYGLLFAYVFSRPVRFFERRVFAFIKSKRRPNSAIKIKRILSILLIIVIALTVIVGGLWLLIPPLYESLQSLVSNLPGYFVEAGQWLSGKLRSNADLRDFAVNLTTNINEFVSDFINQNIIGRVDTIFVAVTTGIYNVLREVINIVIGLIIAAYVLYNREHFFSGVKKFIYAVFKPKWAERFVGVSAFVNKTCGIYILSRLIDSVIIGIVTYIAVSIMRLPYALLIAALIGVTNVIPVFGPFMGAIPAALILLLESPAACLMFVIYIVIMQLLDANLLMPKIQGTGIGLSGFWILFAVTIFGGLFGFWGFLFGVPVFAIIEHFARLIIDKRLKSRGLPVDTAEYRAAGTLDFKYRAESIESIESVNPEDNSEND